MKNKLLRAYKTVAGEIALWLMWIKNIYLVFAGTKSKVRIFQGYGHFWLAKQYADRRSRISKVNKYCGGKRHYVLPVGEYSLGVFNSLELQDLRRRKVISKNFNINEVLKNAYYVTK